MGTEKPTEELLVKELTLLTQLLWMVPPETYLPEGVAVAWTKLSDSHLVPVVYPSALTHQLQLLAREKHLRRLCERLFLFHPQCLVHPLNAQLPTPMYPNAPTISVR